MQKVSIEMPLVRKCDVQKCGYNVNSSCHAKAITIGDQINPECDTFLDSSKRAMETGQVAGVGACKVSGCKYNKDFECTADTITVSYKEDRIKCMTYSLKA